MLNASLVSRVHARNEYHRGKFVLIDQRTNGTFFSPDNERQIYLRREQMPLVGAGRIGFGRRQTPHCLPMSFNIRQAEKSRQLVEFGSSLDRTFMLK